jgi:hypothetical protein
MNNCKPECSYETPVAETKPPTPAAASNFTSNLICDIESKSYTE